ncbi:hypothetical protein MC7420_5325 [Coleofasciculus chthonoplastes PCC 7420]|uniref:Uncharacterized protein n=1 Tax=Coleofasciculus chthonoplastes PCC 7420 TaxID=118168 RepID=B4W557_9CYAN|nr:hypothetical protein [Coleofasciculus chthonoplastes]EDX70697.1 hypothetical protein MC7420_5325 [Coleofasciculus chthonoplastes PCC 7420]
MSSLNAKILGATPDDTWAGGEAGTGAGVVSPLSGGFPDFPRIQFTSC